MDRLAEATVIQTGEKAKGMLWIATWQGGSLVSTLDSNVSLQQWVSIFLMLQTNVPHVVVTP